MHENDRKQIGKLEAYIEKRPKPHVCAYCVNSARDSEGRLRCLEVDGPKYMDIVTENDSCGKWELAR